LNVRLPPIFAFVVKTLRFPFFENAEKMGIDLSQVTHAVLSHSHYDHSDGFEKFFEVNKKAKLYVRKEAGECYYSMHDDGMKYIGPKKGMLEKYKDRIVFVDREYESIGTWAWNMILLSHTTEGLSKIGEKAKLYKEENGELIPDDFAHAVNFGCNQIYDSHGAVLQIGKKYDTSELATDDTMPDEVFGPRADFQRFQDACNMNAAIIQPDYDNFY
jgi:hypothetical protein